MEIHGEEVHDLLETRKPGNLQSYASTKGIASPSEAVVTDSEQMHRYLADQNENRLFTRTKIGGTCAQPHSITQITVESLARDSEGDLGKDLRVARVTFVEVASSTRDAQTVLSTFGPTNASRTELETIVQELTTAPGVSNR